MDKYVDGNNENSINLPKGRLIGLDLFRIFAVWMVFLYHSWHIRCSYGLLQGLIFEGPMFMTAFFMLSGFLLYYTNYTKSLNELSGLKEFYKSWNC